MLENRRSRVYCFCAVRSYHRSRRSAPSTRSSEARTMTETGLFSTNLSNTAPSIGDLLDDKIEEGPSYTISSHLYTTALNTRGVLSTRPQAPRLCSLYVPGVLSAHVSQCDRFFHALRHGKSR